MKNIPFDDFMRMILAILPEAQVDEDLDGQVVVYTNKMVSQDPATYGDLVEFIPEE